MARPKFDLQFPDLETLQNLDPRFLSQFRDPIGGLLYQFGVPTMDSNAFGDRQYHTVQGDTPIAPTDPTTPTDPTDPTDPGKVNPNPMGKFGLPKWYWQWMRTKGIAPAPRRNRDEATDTTLPIQQKGLLG